MDGASDCRSEASNGNAARHSGKLDCSTFVEYRGAMGSDPTSARFSIAAILPQTIECDDWL